MKSTVKDVKKCIIRKGRWVAFPQDPGHQRRSEAFALLEGLVRDTIKCSNHNSVVAFGQHHIFWSLTPYSVDLENYFLKKTSGSFRYNPLHDIELLWWIGVWTITWDYGEPAVRTVC